MPIKRAVSWKIFIQYIYIYVISKNLYALFPDKFAVLFSEAAKVIFLMAVTWSTPHPSRA